MKDQVWVIRHLGRWQQSAIGLDLGKGRGGGKTSR